MPARARALADSTLRQPLAPVSSAPGPSDPPPGLSGSPPSLLPASVRAAHRRCLVLAMQMPVLPEHLLFASIHMYSPYQFPSIAALSFMTGEVSNPVKLA